ncbi:hypothetical protein LWI28_002490 [Acer negundo]|uniref:Uncharacterized protein n=1 Tax=Acer negundo TaxID=4023 RepID=A0AAD5NPD4_ACENE|nr:hypothetical protein LWI28_002490 [Acer negundo]
MLPSSIEHLSENSELSMRYCKNLESLPNSLCNGPNLSYLHLSGSPGVEKMLENVLSSSSSPSGLLSLKRLALSECNMEVLPSALSRLSSLYRLNLRGNEFESLNLELVPSLRSLDISYCKRLKCLQASPRLDCLFANDRFNTGNSFSCQKARFRFSTSSSCCKVKGCGINLVYSDQKDVFEWMNKLGTQMMLSERKKKKQKIAHSESEVNTLCRSPQGRDKVR